MIEEVIDVKGQNLFIKFNNSFENKPTIVFLHDSLGSVQLWRDFPEKLAEATQCNVLVYDRLGYGKSFPMITHERENNYMELEADVLNDLLSELDINDAILFGHSDGGTIALIAASKYPEKVKAVICEAGHIFVEDITVKGVEEALSAYNTTNLPQRLEKYHGDKVEIIVKAWTEIWLSDKFRSWNIEYLLKNIKSPLLFIQGEADEYGTLDQVERTVSQVAGRSEKFIIPNVEHTPHKESPEIVLNKSIEFINSVIN
ncbi:alpha/beta fold hydrolase [Chryseobacterium indoltheticum]|uniref:2-hydroxy-6-oxononadienedioate/2-hydroxy-6-oxonon atrienedioate hydrolase n=1 Tax=Chryseobacterium indoltheticum TaxID=254 RepID=A0A381F9W4_9FLAO|nr:alpha/beta hydrolase [Chryseobacterium indoltheticum]AZA73485.1 alpha/beta hydrolase [Chryseobacterium indoltheticum]SIR00997.1 Pimeloyl-ACP methyl ester carboxylesterase [Chryseobacterium indoltheticum]SUX43361.1 2-hydroxy-6-oxononadienedioate/2-hydroxy-6-oxononatrienedioate hydrolase [Chryseobacterium indoltheticum]